MVVAISLLNSDLVSPNSIFIAKNLLHKYVRQFEKLYGLPFFSINVHQLLHFPDCVRRLGPFWSFSCFEYESLKGQFLKLVHGTWHIDTQIAKLHIQFIKMVRHIQNLPEGSVQKFYLSKKHQRKINELILPNCYSNGFNKNLREIPDYILNTMSSVI